MADMAKAMGKGKLGNLAGAMGGGGPLGALGGGKMPSPEALKSLGAGKPPPGHSGMPGLPGLPGAPKGLPGLPSLPGQPGGDTKS